MFKYECRSVLDFLRSRLSDETWSKLSDAEKHRDVVTRWISASDFNEYMLDENTLAVSHVAISFTKHMGIFIEGTCKLTVAADAFRIGLSFFQGSVY